MPWAGKEAGRRGETGKGDVKGRPGASRAPRELRGRFLSQFWTPAWISNQPIFKANSYQGLHFGSKKRVSSIFAGAGRLTCKTPGPAASADFLL